MVGSQLLKKGRVFHDSLNLSLFIFKSFKEKKEVNNLSEICKIYRDSK